MCRSLICSTRSGVEPGVKTGHGQLAQHERVALDDRGVTDPGDGRAERDGAGAYQGGQNVSHAGSLLPRGNDVALAISRARQAVLTAAVGAAAEPAAEW